MSTKERWTDRLFEAADWQLYCRKCDEKVLAIHRRLGVGRLGPADK